MWRSTFYHDLAGWLMIPFALILYWIEIWILSRLLIETKYEAPLLLDLGGSKRPANAGRNHDQGSTSHRFFELCRSAGGRRCRVSACGREPCLPIIRIAQKTPP